MFIIARTLGILGDRPDTMLAKFKNAVLLSHAEKISFQNCYENTVTTLLSPQGKYAYTR